MNIYGWIFLIGSWGFIFGLTFYCFYKIFFAKKHDVHTPLNIDTQDL